MRADNPAEKIDQKLLTAEYEILQEKLDKIGEFKFKIRGWSITVLSAALAGLISQDMSPIYWVVTFIIPLTFHYQEYEQEVLGVALGRRAKTIEQFLFAVQRDDDSDRSEIMLKIAAKVVESVPRIAAEMRKAKARCIDWEKLFEVRRHNFFFYVQFFLISTLFIIKNIILR
ncbi:hypothetical protein [Geomonas anaerohicana]|uniref:SMODS and SLOG-associating 2TM effector domain-containing protein n=1 Tax=Geomonas anaerohicana TaxID=2798583 RepID=A0ABS0YK11_9BACT|nr:hypothetical protein [Geomonas anaerohicana]MBJ6752681.1 hypothetical protein [Geomonas anaerohicana]